MDIRTLLAMFGFFRLGGSDWVFPNLASECHDSLFQKSPHLATCISYYKCTEVQTVVVQMNIHTPGNRLFLCAHIYKCNESNNGNSQELPL